MTALATAASVMPDGLAAERLLVDLAAQLRAGGLVPYLGPALACLAPVAAPTTHEALADFFAAKVALPRRAKGNAWAAAQHIESTRHRSTVSTLMAEAFRPPVAPTALHRHLAALGVPLIVDTWYDGAMRAALAASRASWGEVQGITRAGIGEDRWYRFYDAGGRETTRDAASAWETVLYKPHGGVDPVRNFLITDADYVEVLTEIDIQTPIPDIVKERRHGRGFLFVGCRFHDQLLRTYARQVSKRSGDRHYVVVEPATLTRNEVKFFAAQGLTPVAVPLPRAVEILCGAVA
ncbi:SIR2 family NAD-dependent protein deacylase [Nitrospirillum amazonense]|uniref:SIR2 family NAD-dependent protein deacylase n=1 Tax=Nitrospirillum amazonense TaxID=28077 RepID=UPI00241263C5|nr:SIR2 family protein [Nitrospirillum amazonense]MDG3439220.1 SIR2 family protein [Nitrospirillum amazonense]